ncbi:MAG: serine O-acetyltransferase [Aquidulcibacter sp.]|jgi:serine O-acetyltransferase|uniref:serine O-acetyltransferase n=1 Tax=Aquidulcibacter sp. TaxID=2052990 RepID=UPI0022C5EA7A|nr:serine O-acetyltransferase [Aquidulcibacter sp.]
MAGASLELVGGMAAGLTNVWTHLRIEAATAAAEEPLLASLLNATILNHTNFDEALAYLLAQKLGGADMNALQMREVCMQAFKEDPAIVRSAQADVRVIKARDPACRTYLQPFLYYKGFASLQAHRVAHHLWATGREMMAFHLQSRVAELFQVDIHPAARLGEGIFMDHATGIVIGETAVVGNNVSMLHNVTLGGTGKEGGDRHPKIGAGVLIGAGAKILGNIKVGEGARIASGSVVLHEVAPGCTVAGIPARPVGGPCCENPADSMDQVFDVATFDPGL